MMVFVNTVAVEIAEVVVVTVFVNTVAVEITDVLTVVTVDPVKTVLEIVTVFGHIDPVYAVLVAVTVSVAVGGTGGYTVLVEVTIFTDPVYIVRSLIFVTVAVHTGNGGGVGVVFSHRFMHLFPISLRTPSNKWRVRKCAKTYQLFTAFLSAINTLAGVQFWGIQWRWTHLSSLEQQSRHVLSKTSSYGIDTAQSTFGAETRHFAGQSGRPTKSQVLG